MNNAIIKLLSAISWCVLTYYLSVKNNPGYGSVMILSLIFIAANIYFYKNWKNCEVTPVITRAVILIPIFIYATLLMGLFINIIPSPIATYLINNSKLTHKFYLLSVDAISMFFSMIILTPILAYIYRSKYPIIIMIFTLIIVAYPQFFMKISLLPLVGIVSAHLMGSLIAIYLSKEIIRRKGYVIERKLDCLEMVNTEA